MFNYFPSGAGNMNFAHLKLNKLDIIPVTIGVAGRENEVGATTSFGNYLAATGGGLPDIPNHIGAPGGIGGEGYIFLRSYYYRNVMDGWIADFSNVYYTHAGISTYGGGSGGAFLRFCNGYNAYTNTNNNLYSYEYIFAHGGNGGIYGGGGATTHDDNVKIGGKGCGNGANLTMDATNGKNTIGSLEEFTGWGVVNNWNGNNRTKGGGGYGGNGGYTSGNNGYNMTDIDYIENNKTVYSCSGGGGYGIEGEGGYACYNNNFLRCVCGGKGGGYGGKYGYGPQNYGSGHQGVAYYWYNGKNSILSDYKMCSRKNSSNGIAIISYYSPVYKT